MRKNAVPFGDWRWCLLCGTDFTAADHDEVCDAVLQAQRDRGAPFGIQAFIGDGE